MLVTIVAAALAVLPQEGVPAAPDDRDVVVTGQRERGSAIDLVEPIAVLNQEAIRALGVTSMTQVMQRLKALATSSTGDDPVFLLNGRRISGFEELQSLPPEAMERTEVLPEEEAPRFGFPPTVRIVNFITKKRFRAVATQQLAGTTTEGGGATNYAEVSSTRIDDARRTSLSVSHFRHSPILQGQRDIVPDPTALFATQGNVTAVGGGSIDARLDQLAGQPVTVAPVPLDPARRGALTDYVAGANRAAVTDLGPYRTLVPRTDIVKVDGTIASPIGKSLNGSLNLTMEAQRIAGLNGLAPATLRVPGSTTLPFADDVSLYRYIPDTLLRQRSTNLNLHAGGTLQGAIGRWTWNATAGYDRVRSAAVAEQGVPTDRLQQAIDAGGDPLMAIDPVSAAQRLANRSRTLTRTLVGKVVATGPLVRLPAGPAQLTVTADYARSASQGFQPGLRDAALDLTRTTRGASVNATVPIASAGQGVLPMLGRLSANGTIGVSDVSDFGRLTSSNYGMTWSPLRPLQFSIAVNETQAAPAIASLTTPTIVTPNVPFFDFTTGSDVVVTAISGGNPALAPERRRVSTLGIALTPIKDTNLRFGVDYVDTQIRNQAAMLGGATVPIQAAFPDRFVRDASGRLSLVDLRSINVARERERKLQFTTSLFTQIGRVPTPPAAPAGGEAPPGPPPAPPKPRPTLFASLTSTLRLDNRVTLRPGLASLDLLDGETLDGSGGRPRWEMEGNIGGSIGPLNIGTFGRLQGPTRIRSTLPASDLRFSGRTWLVLYGSLDTEKIVARPWAKQLSLQLTVENLLNDRIDVRDRTGATPNRFQPAYLDALGRSIRLGVRKLF